MSAARIVARKANGKAKRQRSSGPRGKVCRIGKVTFVQTGSDESCGFGCINWAKEVWCQEDVCLGQSWEMKLTAMEQALRKRRDKPSTNGKLPVYPSDHKVGMGVPEGGSNCDKCEYLKAPQTCGQGKFIEWNGSNRIPLKTDRYCCDFFSE